MRLKQWKLQLDQLLLQDNFQGKRSDSSKLSKVHPHPDEMFMTNLDEKNLQGQGGTTMILSENNTIDNFLPH